MSLDNLVQHLVQLVSTMANTMANAPRTNGTVGVKHAAARLGVTMTYVYDLLYEGKLSGAHKDAAGKWRIPIRAIEERLRERERVEL